MNVSESLALFKGGFVSAEIAVILEEVYSSTIFAVGPIDSPTSMTLRKVLDAIRLRLKMVCAIHYVYL